MSRILTHRPECLSHRSIVRDRKNDTAVIEHPTIKSGFRISAPMSDMYAIEPS